ncbi:MAG TPA: hypothetical protein VLA51_05045, partial [Paracoccaceae bacterium]|nr:hypothetical protein [Paracoccaceae bacterium]
VVHADRIVVLEKGRVAEEGTHDELLAKGGRYAAMWARQANNAEESTRQNLDTTQIDDDGDRLGDYPAITPES